MNVLSIDSTPKTPAIRCFGEIGSIEIMGRSNPVNANDFYKPLFDWLDMYMSELKTPQTMVCIHLESFNTGTSNCLLNLFRKLRKIHTEDHEVSINWYYEQYDEDMQDAGLHYASMFEYPLKLIEILHN